MRVRVESKPTTIDTSRLHGRREEPAALPSNVPEQVKELTDPLTATQIEDLRKAITNELHQCFDPEIPVNIYELGLIYGIDIEPTGSVQVRMTLTSPACPVAGIVKRAVPFVVTVERKPVNLLS